MQEQTQLTPVPKQQTKATELSFASTAEYAINFVRKNFVSYVIGCIKLFFIMIGVSILVHGAIAIVGLSLGFIAYTIAGWVGVSIVGIVAVVGLFLAQGFISALGIIAIYNFVSGSDELSLAAFLRISKGRAWDLLVAMALLSAIVMLLLPFGIITLGIGILVFMVSASFADLIVISGGARGLGAIWQSINTTRGHRVKLILYHIANILPVYFASFVFVGLVDPIFTSSSEPSFNLISLLAYLAWWIFSIAYGLYIYSFRYKLFATIVALKQSETPSNLTGWRVTIVTSAIVFFALLGLGTWSLAKWASSANLQDVFNQVQKDFTLKSTPDKNQLKDLDKMQKNLQQMSPEQKEELRDAFVKMLKEVEQEGKK